jgi:hypothetical protein
MLDKIKKLRYIYSLLEKGVDMFYVRITTGIAWIAVIIFLLSNTIWLNGFLDTDLGIGSSITYGVIVISGQVIISGIRRRKDGSRRPDPFIDESLENREARLMMIDMYLMTLWPVFIPLSLLYIGGSRLQKRCATA